MPATVTSTAIAANKASSATRIGRRRELPVGHPDRQPRARRRLLRLADDPLVGDPSNDCVAALERRLGREDMERGDGAVE